MSKSGKQIRKARSSVELDKNYMVNEAIEKLKNVSFTKFDQTLEIVMKLGVDPRHSDQMVRGVASLPAGTGKNVRVFVICKDEKVNDALNAGADRAGSIDIIDDIKNGKIEFDVCIATPDMMATVGQVARILGPKGLMPNPKLGTVTVDIASAVNNAKTGQVEFRVEKAGIIHAGIGKISFSTEDLMSNVKSFVSAVSKARPSGAKGVYIKSVFLSSSMGPGLKVDIANI